MSKTIIEQAIDNVGNEKLDKITNMENVSKEALRLFAEWCEDNDTAKASKSELVIPKLLWKHKKKREGIE